MGVLIDKKMKTKIEATIIETDLKKKLKWRRTNHKSIPKLLEWAKNMGLIIIRQDKKSVWTINKDDLTIVIWRIKGTKILRRR